MKFNCSNNADVNARAGRLSPAQRPSERGMALIITLIMLSVTLVMAIAFLAVANRERASVTTTTDQTNARLAADSALAAAQAQILANLIGTPGNNYQYDLLVSTNYINAYGFDTTAPLLDPTNVNYDYLSTGVRPISGANFESVVANLQYLPRAPVLVSTNEPTGRFYLDLNRNGVFDDSGTNIPNVVFDSVSGNNVTNGIIFQNGDPQWIGVLERPDALHSPDNHFIARYAFIALPVGNSLDLNYIHNQALQRTVNPSYTTSPGTIDDSYIRNQGVGSWEINLAAFLTDLNTNQWDPPTLEYPAVNNFYDYREPNSANRGAGFQDALSLLSWRYGYGYANQASADQIFPNAAIAFSVDNIDEYGDGPLQLTTTNINESLTGNPDTTSLPWAGATSTNQFFNLPSDLFDPTKSSTNFVDHLTAAGGFVAPNGLHPTYDRYTFYRMLSELGTDSSADDAGKIDLNYSNAVALFDNNGMLTNIVIKAGAQTNLVPWNPLQFFSVAADRLLRTYTTNWFMSNPTNYLATYYGIPNYSFPIDPATGLGFTNNNPLNGCPLGTNFIPAFSLTNIPVYVNNGLFVYSPAVNRLLQLAANIYDASTNGTYPNEGFFPSVFRPNFLRDNLGNVYVDGYYQVTGVPGGIADAQLNLPVDVRTLATGFTGGPINDKNVYGVPWIVGAKKGIPNFNQFYMLNTVQLTRKIQVNRSTVEGLHSATAKDFSTNEMFIMSITNQVGFSLWNSYATNYPAAGAPAIVVNDIMYLVMSNALYTTTSNALLYTYTNNLTAQPWPGANWDTTIDPNTRQAAPGSFFHGIFYDTFLPQGAYQFTSGIFQPLAGTPSPSYDPTVLNAPNLPQLALMTTNRFQAFILDNGHLLDYVSFNGPDGVRDLNAELMDPFTNSPSQMWVTNASGNAHNGVNQGVADQIFVSKTGPSAAPTSSGYSWKAPPNMPPGLQQIPQVEADFFKAFFTGLSFQEDGNTYNNNETNCQAPYTPTRTMYNLVLWQANDPLVHYLASDLTESNSYTGLRRTDDPVDSPMPQIVQDALGQSSSVVADDRYQPWGMISQFALLNNVDKNPYNLAYRDPLMYGSDNWDFPTNRYPNVGWLGRVHRGTPWQTVYLKATNILALNDTVNQVSGSTTWMNWLGDASGFDATNSAPNQDAVLFDIFTTSLDDNASRGTLSVNQQHLAAWSAILSGVNVITNVTPTTPTFGTAPVQTNVVINPGGLDTNSPVWRMVEGADGINAVRANLFPNGFPRVGDILHVPALTEHSPFLNTNNAVNPNDRIDYDVSDEMYERIPQQIMGLLRGGSTPRYVIYCYGQALRPAQNGIALDLGHNGLVTNYAVVAESAARAVISVHPQVTTNFSPSLNALIPVTNYTTTVESYTQLPPN